MPADATSSTPPLIVVLGPTATGKSTFGMRLAEELDGEIINADALQVYRGLDIGTAKPSAAMRRAVPHHLIDILDPHERFSAGEFARRARAAIAEIGGRGKRAILVGGSGLYLRALVEGMSPIPPGDPSVRAALAERLDHEGLPALFAELRRLDPETAARLAAGDRQRILRALEVVHSSGRPLSSWIRGQPFGKQSLPAFRIGLTLPRTILYDRIVGRVRDMVERGWLEEVITLLDQGVEPSSPAFQAIGYRQLVRHVEEKWSLEAALEDTIRATRRYAKRQMTWFRKEMGIRWVPALRLAGTIPSLLQDLKSAGGTFAQ
ncbi:MAG: tRNA (adenosine(37)-N6)-dimethylallyltransferase MiaA [bacterium]|nr:tRNA (adenosine(37)-N6)-dimethylallyltransferase MiaA [bacterium]